MTPPAANTMRNPRSGRYGGDSQGRTTSAGYKRPASVAGYAPSQRPSTTTGHPSMQYRASEVTSPTFAKSARSTSSSRLQPLTPDSGRRKHDDMWTADGNKTSSYASAMRRRSSPVHPDLPERASTSMGDLSKPRRKKMDKHHSSNDENWSICAAVGNISDTMLSMLKKQHIDVVLFQQSGDCVRWLTSSEASNDIDFVFSGLEDEDESFNFSRALRSFPHTSNLAVLQVNTNSGRGASSLIAAIGGAEAANASNKYGENAGGASGNEVSRLKWKISSLRDQLMRTNEELAAEKSKFKIAPGAGRADGEPKKKKRTQPQRPASVATSTPQPKPAYEPPTHALPSGLATVQQRKEQRQAVFAEKSAERARQLAAEKDQAEQRIAEARGKIGERDAEIRRLKAKLEAADGLLKGTQAHMSHREAMNTADLDLTDDPNDIIPVDLLEAMSTPITMVSRALGVTEPLDTPLWNDAARKSLLRRGMAYMLRGSGPSVRGNNAADCVPLSLFLKRGQSQGTGSAWDSETRRWLMQTLVSPGRVSWSSSVWQEQEAQRGRALFLSSTAVSGAMSVATQKAISNETKNIFSWEYDPIFDDMHELPQVSVDLIEVLGVHRALGISHDSLVSFIHQVEHRHDGHVYHNFAHSVATLHSVVMMLAEGEMLHILTSFDVLALLVAAITVSMCHTGVTNAFHTTVVTDLARQYSHAVQEQHRLSTLWMLLDEDEASNILLRLSPFEQRYVRQVITDATMSCDVAVHVSSYSAFATRADMDRVWTCKSDGDRNALVCAVLQCSLWSSAFRGFESTMEWFRRLDVEGTMQGEAERHAAEEDIDVTVSAFMDGNSRPAISVPRLALICTEALCAPLLYPLTHAFPSLTALVSIMENSRAQWRVMLGIELGLLDVSVEDVTIEDARMLPPLDSLDGAASLLEEIEKDRRKMKARAGTSRGAHSDQLSTNIDTYAMRRANDALKCLLSSAKEIPHAGTASLIASMRHDIKKTDDYTQTDDVECENVSKRSPPSSPEYTLSPVRREKESPDSVKRKARMKQLREESLARLERQYEQAIRQENERRREQEEEDNARKEMLQARRSWQEGVWAKGKQALVDARTREEPLPQEPPEDHRTATAPGAAIMERRLSAAVSQVSHPAPRPNTPLHTPVAPSPLSQSFPEVLSPTASVGEDDGDGSLHRPNMFSAIASSLVGAVRRQSRAGDDNSPPQGSKWGSILGTLRRTSMAPSDPASLEVDVGTLMAKEKLAQQKSEDARRRLREAKKKKEAEEMARIRQEEWKKEKAQSFKTMFRGGPMNKRAIEETRRMEMRRDQELRREREDAIKARKQAEREERRRRRQQWVDEPRRERVKDQRERLESERRDEAAVVIQREVRARQQRKREEEGNDESTSRYHHRAPPRLDMNRAEYQRQADLEESEEESEEEIVRRKPLPVPQSDSDTDSEG